MPSAPTLAQIEQARCRKVPRARPRAQGVTGVEGARGSPETGVCTGSPDPGPAVVDRASVRSTELRARRGHFAGERARCAFLQPAPPTPRMRGRRAGTRDGQATGRGVVDRRWVVALSGRYDAGVARPLPLHRGVSYSVSLRRPFLVLRAWWSLASTIRAPVSRGPSTLLSADRRSSDRSLRAELRRYVVVYDVTNSAIRLVAIGRCTGRTSFESPPLVLDDFFVANRQLRS
jgi:hypothetical protein